MMRKQAYMYVFIGQMIIIGQDESGDLLNISFLRGEKYDIVPYSTLFWNVLHTKANR